MADRALLVLLLSIVAGPLVAQVPAEPAAPTRVQVFEEAVDVRVVNLEAVVTGAKRLRAKGLGPKDFRLLVDGVETPITFCTEIDEEKRSSPPAVPGEAGRDGVASPGEEATWQSRNILVFLDEATMLEARRDFVVRSLVQQLDRLAPGDRMAVVAFDGSRLDLLLDWTDDRALLRSTFAAVEARPTRGIQEEASRRQLANNRAFIAQATGRSEVSAGGRFGDLRPDSLVLPSGDTPDAGIANLIPTVGGGPADFFRPLDRFVPVGEAAAAAMRGMPVACGQTVEVGRALPGGFCSAIGSIRPAPPGS